MKAKLISLLLIVILVVATLAMAGCKAEEAPPEAGVPELIKCSGWNVGTGIHLVETITADTIAEKYGCKVRIIPSAYEMGRFAPLATGEVDFLLNATNWPAASEGIWDFADMVWGPQQDVRLVWGGGVAAQGPAVRGDNKDIFTPADLMGKRVPYPVGSLGSALVPTAALYFAGLTWEDVIKVEVPSYSAGVKALDEGKVDMVNLVPLGPQAREIESHPWGLRWLDMPASDTAGWARVQGMVPFTFSPIVVTEGAGIDPGHPVTMLGGAMTFAWLSTASTPEDLVYFWTKALHECQPEYTANFPFPVNTTLEDVLRGFHVSYCPVHKGALRYFKEIGVWTDELDAHNEEILQRLKTLRGLFDEAVATATEEKMKAEDFPAFWLEYRAAAGYPVTKFE